MYVVFLPKLLCFSETNLQHFRGILQVDIAGPEGEKKPSFSGGQKNKQPTGANWSLLQVKMC